MNNKIEECKLNVLFLTLLSFDSLKERNIYTDLLREFTKDGHQLYVISPIEKREGQETHLIHEDNATILRLKIGDTQKTSTIKKGVNTVLIEPTVKKAIKKFFSEVKFDLILYSTPPITLVSAIDYVKKRDNAKSYLLLKDIFPQNAVDIGLMTTSGIKGLLYKHFRKQEKKLYRISDRIGCMSQANVDYVIKHNPEVDPKKVEVCPNSIEVIDKSVTGEDRLRIRTKYNIPLDKTVFIYGGNLGKPQGIPFLIECLKKCSDIQDAFFLIVGDGTEYPKLEQYAKSSHQRNLLLLKRLPKEDYDTLVGACDIGMIFLDYRFTIPNFPSRILSYMAAKIQVLTATDSNTDIGKVVSDENFGYDCISNSVEGFMTSVRAFLNTDTSFLGMNGYAYLKSKYTSKIGYSIIKKVVQED